MHQSRETARFLRAAVKAGLRMQNAVDPDKPGPASNGVATLQRIKASVRKKKPSKQT